MSKLETPMTRRYWERVGGTLIEEFPAVRASADPGGRKIDGVILPHGEKRIARWREISVDGEEVIVIQAKARRLGMSLMGQALFSKDLLKQYGAKPIKTVALCSKDDAVLRPLAEKHGIEVVIDEEAPTLPDPAD